MDLTLKECFQRVLNEYAGVRYQSIKNHKLAHFLKITFPNTLQKIIANQGMYVVQGSAGKGNWARCPWVVVLDVLVTSTPQSGYYPVYLFRADMRGFYLSLNQGVTEVKNKYKVSPKEVLKIRASDFRAQIGSIPIEFSKDNIDLAAISSAELPSFYEAGNICSKYYDRQNLPSNEELIIDFRRMLNLYQILSYNETATELVNEDEEKYSKSGTEDLRKFRQHLRLERNYKLPKAAKDILGYSCQVCGFNFESFYGDVGKKFIEAHHLKPISELKGQIVELNPQDDFAVLCSNCHRMIHRTKRPEDIEGFKKLLSQKD